MNDRIIKPTSSISLLILIAIVLPSVAFSQDEEKPTFPLETIYAKRKPWGMRKIFKNFRLGVSTGYGNTYFRHKIDGYGAFQPGTLNTRIFPIGNAATRYMNWVNDAVLDTLQAPGPDRFSVTSDTTKLGFKSNALNIPLRATLHYEFLKRYRIGGGYSYEYMHLGRFEPLTYKDKLQGFNVNRPGGFMQKYFGMAGVSFYRIDNFLFTGDVNIGGFKPGKNFNSSIIKKGIFVNAGVTIEREFSEYLRAFIRPSFDYKSYTLNVPQGGIKHHMNALYINIGFTYNLPELPRCYNKDCHAQMNHAHGDREYRSAMHRIWKKQDPMYGENYPKLFRHKGKNRKKLNPY